MNRLSYATGNAVKFQQAVTTCQTFDIALEQVKLDITEVQAEAGAVIARDKAEKAFAELGEPLVVSDDSWTIPGLNGFPGPYMKYMNEWFRPQDWLHLTSSLADRRIILEQIVVYQDKHEQQVFSAKIEGILLSEIRGDSGQSHDNIISFDNGKSSLGETIERKLSITSSQRNVWHDFAAWYKERP